MRYSFADLSNYVWFRQVEGSLPFRIERFNDDGTSCLIAPFEDNPDYQQYLAWLDEGNTPELWNPEEQ